MNELISTTRWLTRSLAGENPNPEAAIYKNLPWGKNRAERRRFVNSLSRERRETLVLLLLDERNQAEQHADEAKQEPQTVEQRAAESGLVVAR